MPGEVFRIDARASVQFSGDCALTFRVTAVPDMPTYDGWIWLTGYVLDDQGQAIDRREIFVQRAGLHRLGPPRPTTTRRPAPAHTPNTARTSIPTGRRQRG
ncbi:hypothetical protein [Micromonospora zhanjiangensis]|uniref:Uncharacterized protein n=1 Tax=Micromonospora zhanjiangensis TaxID=1522057 RepID=A0ABV8KS47_9ACTN